MVQKMITSSLLLILTSVLSATAPVAFADPAAAQVRPVSSLDDGCYYAHCTTCGWSGSHHTGKSAEADASKDATEHMNDKEKNDKVTPYHTTQATSC